jgi:hypothetical protein
MGEGFKFQKGTPVFDTNVYLYNLGDEYNVLTGGWDAGFTLSTGSGSGSQTKNADNLYMTAHNNLNFTHWQRTYQTQSKVDVTAYSKLKILTNVTIANAARLDLGLVATDNAEISGGACKLAQLTTVSGAILTLDISAMSGTYYIGVCANSYFTPANGDCAINAYKIWLEV